MAKMQERLYQYARLMRLDKPIGSFLLLWPTLWALWLASSGNPPVKLVLIFICGVFIMRSAGCVINDYADRHFDGKVSRTRERPLAAKRVQPLEALLLFAVLLLIAFFLALQLNTLALAYAFPTAFLAILYPFTKRFMMTPQIILGMAFSCGVPMAFAAVQDTVPATGWLLFITAIIWPVIYDTFYAMTDKADDSKIGLKSTAILFGRWDKIIIGLLQIVFISLLILVGVTFQLHTIYYLSVLAAAFLSLYHQYLIKDRDPALCFKAFLHNNWIGFLLFLGIFLSFK